jgi:hypothetical protein
VLPSGYQGVSEIVFYSSAYGVCVVDPIYHGDFFDKLRALIAYTIRELCNKCFDSYAESVLNERREIVEWLAHLGRALR